MYVGGVCVAVSNMLIEPRTPSITDNLFETCRLHAHHVGLLFFYFRTRGSVILEEVHPLYRGIAIFKLALAGRISGFYFRTNRFAP